MPDLKPDGFQFPTHLMIPKAQIEEDLKQLQPVTNCIRTYAVDQGLDQAVPVAHALGMQVLLGIWIGRDPAANERQIALAIELAKAHPDTVKAIIVGNEVLLRGEQRGETLAEMATRIRRESGRPVTYADVWEFWLKAPPALKDSVDFVTIHVLPYWEDQPLPVSEGVRHLEDIVARVRAAFPGRHAGVTLHLKRGQRQCHPELQKCRGILQSWMVAVSFSEVGSLTLAGMGFRNP